MPRLCVICRKSQSSDFSIFSFPSSISQRIAWLKIISSVNSTFSWTQKEIAYLLKNGVCEDHFPKCEMKDGKKKRLNKEAIPSLNLLYRSKEEIQFLHPMHVNTLISVNATEGDKCDPELIIQKKTKESNNEACFIEFNISENGTVKSCKTAWDEIHQEKKLCNLKNGLNIPCSLCNLTKFIDKKIEISKLFDETLKIWLSEKFSISLENINLNGYVCSECVLLIEEIRTLKSSLDSKILSLNALLYKNSTTYNEKQHFEKSFELKKLELTSTQNIKTSFSCLKCSLIFDSESALTSHMKIHGKCSPLNVSPTSEDKRRSSSTKMDSKVDHFEYTTAKVFDCHICSRQLTSKARLKLHLFKFHKIGEPQKKSFSCTLCNKLFSTKSGLTYHLGAKHKKGKRYNCKLCSKIFYNSMLYKSHMLYIHGEKSVICENCGDMFFTVSKLNSHKNAVHRNAQTWECKICSLKFTTTWAYRDHTMKHKMKHHCTYCNAYFVRGFSLTTHLWKHGIYRCHACDIKFDTVDSYASHSRSIHQKNISKKLLTLSKAAMPKISKKSISNAKPDAREKSPVGMYLLMNEEVFNNTNLNAFSMNNEKDRNENIIEGAEDLSAVDSLTICNNVEELDIDTVDTERMALEDVSLLSAHMLDDIDDNQLKPNIPPSENDSICINQVFQNDVGNESVGMKNSREDKLCNNISINNFSPRNAGHSNDLLSTSSNANDVSVNSEENMVSNVVYPNLPALVDALRKDHWNLNDSLESKDTIVQTVIHTLTVDDETPVEDNSDLSKTDIVTCDNVKDNDRHLPSFSLDIDCKDNVHYKYVMVVNSNVKKKEN